jgi:hypothetical protein
MNQQSDMIQALVGVFYPQSVPASQATLIPAG